VLDFVPTISSQKSNFKLYFICDSYLGADQEFDLPLRVSEFSSSLATNENKDTGRSDRKRKHEDVKDGK
jgi:hypothetical protein